MQRKKKLDIPNTIDEAKETVDSNNDTTMPLNISEAESIIEKMEALIKKTTEKSTKEDGDALCTMLFFLQQFSKKHPSFIEDLSEKMFVKLALVMTLLIFVYEQAFQRDISLKPFVTSISDRFQTIPEEKYKNDDLAKKVFHLANITPNSLETSHEAEQEKMLSDASQIARKDFHDSEENESVTLRKRPSSVQHKKNHCPLFFSRNALKTGGSGILTGIFVSAVYSAGLSVVFTGGLAGFVIGYTARGLADCCLQNCLRPKR